MTHTAMVQQSLKMALHETLERLYLRSWRVLKFDSSRLLTSDHPFGYWSPRGDHDGAFGVDNAPVIFHPLDRQTALMMSLRRIPEVVRPSGATRARQINLAVAGEASKWSFYHPDDDPLDGLIIPRKAKFVDEVVGQRIDADGNFRDLHRLVRRTDLMDEM
jgi:hypothetical protein